ncbi:MAG TPA: SprT-like domain-containing protein [Rubricoccaceae bacterium]
MEDPDDVLARTRALLDTLGPDVLGRPLKGWTVRWDRARRRLGLCTWTRGGRTVRVISLSRPLADALGWAVMDDVARHEIAHALDYETRGRSGHDAVWRNLAVRCGADPTAAYDGPIPDDGTSRLVATCPGCGFARPFHRTPTRAYVCPACARRPAAPRRVFLEIAERATGRIVRTGGDAPGPSVGVRYAATCPACHTRVERVRRPTRRLACAACCRRHAGGRFSELYELAFARVG